MARLSKAGERVACHLGMDGDSFEEDYRYQPGRWTKPVYAIGNRYWSAGAAPPKHVHGTLHDFDEPWRRVVSSYDGKTVLWTNGED